VSTEGDSFGFLGLYTLNVGCLSGLVSFNDNSLLDVSVTHIIGTSVTGVYTFLNPTSSRTWCTIESNTYTQTSGGASDWLTGTGV